MEASLSPDMDFFDQASSASLSVNDYRSAEISSGTVGISLVTELVLPRQGDAELQGDAAKSASIMITQTTNESVIHDIQVFPRDLSATVASAASASHGSPADMHCQHSEQENVPVMLSSEREKGTVTQDVQTPCHESGPVFSALISGTYNVAVIPEDQLYATPLSERVGSAESIAPKRKVGSTSFDSVDEVHRGHVATSTGNTCSQSPFASPDRTRAYSIVASR